MSDEIMKTIFSNNLQYYMNAVGVSQSDIMRDLKIPSATISSWVNGKRLPRMGKIQELADYLNITKSDLIENVVIGCFESEKEAFAFKKDIENNPNGIFSDKRSIYDSNKNSQNTHFTLAIQKFQNKEDLTYEEENAIIEYVESNQFEKEKEDIKRIAQKAYGEIYYRHSHSYASSAEELDKLQDAKQIELERKRPKRFKLHETEGDGPPKPFTRPLQSSYDKPNADYQDNSLKLHTNTRGINWEQLDDFRFDELMLKLDRGEELTPAEVDFKSAYLERCLKKVGYIFAKFYSMLNVEGQKKADEQIDRAIEQVELLTKIPEYQKKPTTPAQE